MRVVILTDCYFPIEKSVSFLISDLAQEIVENFGHTVTIVTTGNLSTGSYQITVDGNISVLRVSSPEIKARNYFVRGLLELIQPFRIWFLAKAWFQANPQDLLIFYSPSAFWAPLIKRLRTLWKCRTFLIIRDVFPEWAVQLGLIKNKYLIMFLRGLSKKQFDYADRIGAQSSRDAAFLKADLGLSLSPLVEVLYNWRRVGTMNFSTAGRWRKHFGFSRDEIVFVFGGTFGVAQGPHLLLQLGERILKCQPNIRMLIVGQGVDFQKMQLEAQKKGLRNMVFSPSLPLPQYLELLSEMDVGGLTLHPDYRIDNIPGRVLDYMLCKKPIFAALNEANELGELINQERIGFCGASGDLESLVQGMVWLCQSSSIRAAMGERSREVMASHFSPSRAASQILDSFHALDNLDAKTERPIHLRRG